MNNAKRFAISCLYDMVLMQERCCLIIDHVAFYCHFEIVVFGVSTHLIRSSLHRKKVENYFHHIIM